MAGNKWWWSLSSKRRKKCRQNEHHNLFSCCVMVDLHRFLDAVFVWVRISQTLQWNEVVGVCMYVYKLQRGCAESWILWVGRDLWRPSDPTPCNAQGLPGLHQCSEPHAAWCSFYFPNSSPSKDLGGYDGVNCTRSCFFTSLITAFVFLEFFRKKKKRTSCLKIYKSFVAIAGTIFL